MKAHIVAAEAFRYTVEVRRLAVPAGNYSFAITSAWLGAKDPTSERTAVQISLDARGADGLARSDRRRGAGMSTAIETARLVRLQAQALLRFLERKGLVLGRGDPVKEIWADVAAFAHGNLDLSALTQIWQRNRMSACDATCVGLNHECVNAAVFLALYRFCRETEAYRPAAVTPWIAYALAFKAGRRHCTDDEQRLLFEEFEDEIEAAHLLAGLGHGRTDSPPWTLARTRGSP